LRINVTRVFESGSPSSKRTVPAMVAPFASVVSMVVVRLAATASGVREASVSTCSLLIRDAKKSSANGTDER
jgi:hypothetical protein